EGERDHGEVDAGTAYREVADRGGQRGGRDGPGQDGDGEGQSEVDGHQAGDVRPVGARNPVSRLNCVVLPAPLGPTRACTLPSATSRSIPSTARNPRNSFTRP